MAVGEEDKHASGRKRVSSTLLVWVERRPPESGSPAQLRPLSRAFSGAPESIPGGGLHPFFSFEKTKGFF